MNGIATNYLYDGGNIATETTGGNTASCSTASASTNATRAPPAQAQSSLTDELAAPSRSPTAAANPPPNTHTTPSARPPKRRHQHQPLPVHRTRKRSNGLQYNRARYYSPTTARFTSQDPSAWQAAAPTSTRTPKATRSTTSTPPATTSSKAGESITGFGDAASGGLTIDIRSELGLGQPDFSSGAYQGGTDAGILAATLTPGDEEAAVADAAEDTLTMDEAIELAADHAGPEGVMETTGNGLNYQFRGMDTDEDGNPVARIGRLDVNPADSHVAQNGPHLNLETQVKGDIVSNVHIPIDPSTVRLGDIP